MLGISVMTHLAGFRQDSLLVSVNYGAFTMATTIGKQNGGIVLAYKRYLCSKIWQT